MKLIGYSIIVAMTLMMIASVTSASVTSVGGVEATAQSGAGFGDTYGNFVFNDDMTTTPFLNASVWAFGQVNPGTTGSFSASYDTGGAKTESIGDLATDGFNLETTVNGKPAIAVSKTSNPGLAYANASMYAEARVNFADIYAQGMAYAYATAYLSGTGTVSASVTATEVSYDAIVNTGICESEAVGNVENAAVTIAGTVDDPNDVISGWGMVGSYSWADEDSEDGDVGTYADVWEQFGLDARKQISFDGPTKITATVTGEEFAEPMAIYCTLNLLEAMSDIEATSKLSGLASVYKKGDYAYSYADFDVEADTGLIDWFEADEDIYLEAYAQRLLADPNTANAARGTAKVDSATWSAAAMTHYPFGSQIPYTYPVLVGIEGETGFTENGEGVILSGLGVGAATKGANAVYAYIDQTEQAEYLEGFEEGVEVGLDAPQYSGTDTGGVGAYVGLSNIDMYLMDVNDPTGLIWTKSIADQNGIWWNNNAIYNAQGHGSFSTPQDSIQPMDTGVAYESGPIMWTWQAGSMSGAYLRYLAGTIWTL